MKRLYSSTALILAAGLALGASGAVADATKTDRDALTGANVKSEAQSDPSGSGLTSAGSHGGSDPSGSGLTGAGSHGGSNPQGSGLTGAGGNQPVPQADASRPAAPSEATSGSVSEGGRDAKTGDKYTTGDPAGSGLTSAGQHGGSNPEGSGLTGAGEGAATATDRDALTGQTKSGG